MNFFHWVEARCIKRRAGQNDDVENHDHEKDVQVSVLHLHVCVRTLVDWNRQARGEIRVTRPVEVEALQEKILASHEDPPAIGLPDGSSSPGKRDFCTVFALFLPRFCIIFRKLLSFVTVRFEL